MIDTIIFDLDGTLLNTLEDLKDSTNFALKQYGYPEHSIDDIRRFVGDGVQKLIERALPEGAANPVFAECLKTFKENYAENMYNKTAPYNGVPELLLKLRDNGFKTAVVSNKFDMAVKKLCKTYFDDLIPVAIGESENVRKKPAPDSVFRAMELLKSKSENCIYCGDSDVDVHTARNSGLKCIGVTWGFRSRDLLKKEGANFIVDVPEQIFEILTALK